VGAEVPDGVGATVTVADVSVVCAVDPFGRVTVGDAAAVVVVVVVTGVGTVVDVDAYWDAVVVVNVDDVGEFVGGLIVVDVVTVVVFAATAGTFGCNAGGCVAGEVVDPRSVNAAGLFVSWSVTAVTLLI
jgi:hypothetical protein